MLFYRLYRPLGRVGTVIPQGDKFYLLNFVLPEKFDYKVGFFVIHDYLVNGFRTRGKKSKDIPERIPVCIFGTAYLGGEADIPEVARDEDVFVT